MPLPQLPETKPIFIRAGGVYVLTAQISYTIKEIVFSITVIPNNRKLTKKGKTGKIDTLL